MTNITASNQFYGNYPDSDINQMVRHPIKFYKETFSFPDKLKLPDDHFETTAFCVAGDIQSGKTHAVKYMAYLCSLLWGDDIDFFECDDIFSTIEAVKQSDKYAHFVFLDDVIKPGFDSRRSMTGANVSASQKYMVIRHEIKKGYLDYGYLIIGLASQMYSAVEKRIRKHMSFTLFKTYDTDCENLIDDWELLDFLRLLKDKSSRVKDWRYRRFGVAVASDNLYTPIIIPKHYKSVDWIKINVDSLVVQQINECVEFLINYDLRVLGNSDLRGILYLFFDRLKKKYKFFEITPAMFSEIIYRARLIHKIKLYKGDIKIEDYLGELEQYINSRTQNDEEKEVHGEPKIIERLIYALRWNKCAHIDQLCQLSGGDYGTVSALVTNYSDHFARVGKGIYCLKINKIKVSEEDVINIEKELGTYKKPSEKLSVGEWD